jgi:hypothetical protein
LATNEDQFDCRVFGDGIGEQSESGLFQSHPIRGKLALTAKRMVESGLSRLHRRKP